VHDNIYYFPSQGSVQGAQDTLDKKRGNAIDTASLLIALLRSAGIPARYVYGTVEIPIAQAMNWVGGAKTDDATQQILGQGGVPNVALTSGGRTVTMRIEHVWVEALIQYNPGRGAKHIQGQSIPDTWVPMDASFKQYTFTQGMDLQTAVPLDAQALLTAAQQGATVNEAEGWVQNLNSAAVQNCCATPWAVGLMREVLRASSTCNAAPKKCQSPNTFNLRRFLWSGNYNFHNSLLACNIVFIYKNIL
jgi:hypothetical protein